MTTSPIPSITINHDACQHDGLCTQLCPMRILTYQAGTAPEVRRSEECILCGHCVASCPSNAIIHDGLDLARLRKKTSAESPTPVQAYALLSERRSVRNYKRDPPPRELFERVIEVAGYAPGSPHHRLGWERHFTVVVGEEKMRQVREITVDYTRRICSLLDSLLMRCAALLFESARAGREVLPDLRMRLAEWEQGRDLITYGAPAAIFAHAPVNSALPQIDCDAALSSVLLYAHANGLGTCWNGILQDAARGHHLRGFNDLRRLLKIPSDHVCYAAATVGYPSLRMHRVPPRKVAVSFVT